MPEGFKGLDAWQSAMRLALDVYEATAGFPETERFGLVSQLRRSSVSVPSNIAEGYERGSRQDYRRFLRVALGSLAEVETQLLLARELGYLEPGAKPFSQLELCRRLLAGLARSLA